jgi:cell division septum initiation protein DivIVA
MSAMEITARELRDIEIHSEIRGYSRDEVNDLLERASAAIEASNERLTQLQQRLTSAQTEALGNRETEDILHRTLLLAQRAADEAVAEATAKSRQMLDEAEMSSRRLVADSEAEARKRGETERRRLEEEVVDLAARRDTLLADVEALTRFEAEYRERMVRALESDLSVLRSRPTTAPASLPETSDVKIPEAKATSTAVPTPPTSSTPPAPAAPNVGSSGGAAPGAGPVRTDASSSDAPRNRSGAGAKFEATSGPPNPPASRPGPASASAASSSANLATSEIDVRSLFESSREQTAAVASAPPQAPAAKPAEPARATGVKSIDLSSAGGLDDDILDDDAFFATLRDAVHDEKPLGPRDDDEATGESTFFDQDAERGSFRDVFRRRR